MYFFLLAEGDGFPGPWGGAIAIVVGGMMLLYRWVFSLGAGVAKSGRLDWLWYLLTALIIIVPVIYVIIRIQMGD